MVICGEIYIYIYTVPSGNRGNGGFNGQNILNWDIVHYIFVPDGNLHNFWVITATGKADHIDS